MILCGNNKQEAAEGQQNYMYSLLQQIIEKLQKLQFFVMFVEK